MELDSKLESENHGLDDQEDIVKVQQGKSGTSRRYLYLLLLIIAIIAISAIIAVIALAIALGVQLSQSQSQSSSQTGGPTMSPTDSAPETCLTQGCIQLAAQMTAAMNQSVDPCEDFYEFTCGNWGQRNLIPPDDEVQNQLIKLGSPIFQRLADIAASGDDGGVEAVGKAFDLYRSCMDAATIESLGATPLLNLIRDTLGGWPLIGIPAETSPWSINSMDFFYEKTHGSFAFFNFRLYFSAVTQSRSKYALHFEQQLISLTSFISTNTTSADAAEAAAVLSLLNPSVSPAVYVEAIQNVLEFDQRLNEILEPPLNVPSIDDPPPLNQSYIYTFESLQTLWPGFDWEGFVNYMYEDISGLQVPQDLEIVVTTPAYFERLGPLLQDTDPEVIRDYTKVLFLITSFRGLSSIFRQIATDINPGDLDSCMSFVQSVLPIALARPFVEQFIPKGTRERVAMMVDYLMEGFKERVNQMDWLSDFSKQNSIEKVNAITAHSAYPAEIFDNDYINGLYSRFTANSSDYFGNRLSEYELTLQLRLNLTHGYNKAAWPIVDTIAFPTLVNAFYSPQMNQISVLAAIANEPIFKADWPDYQMFGGLGTIVGHEITHGFDNNGQQYDKNGIRRMMWSNESQEEFCSRLPCFVDQYNQYTFEGVPVNGNISLSENVADNGGLQASFQAYRMMAAISPQPMLPSLPYTPDQLFFITYGQVWCELALPSHYQFLRYFDPHAPGPARVRAVVNFRQFAEAFNCPAESPMNPMEKCIIW